MTNQMTPDEKRALLAQLLREKASKTKTDVPLTYGQRGLWYIHQIAPHNSAYNIAFSARIRSAVDLDKLLAALQTLTERHETLRTVFAAPDGNPVQEVYDYREAYFEQVDAAGLDDETLYREVAREYHRPFDLAGGPVARWVLFTRAPEDHVLLMVVHHIIADGWSMWLWLNELHALMTGETPPPVRQYREYVQWQQNRQDTPEGEKDRTYWMTQLAGDLPVLNLPTDYPRPNVQSFNGSSVHFKLDATQTVKLRAFAQAEGVTLFVLLLSVYQTLLHRWSGQDDVLVGIPTLGRSQAKFEKIFGYFVNPVVMRANFADNPTFRNLLEQMRTGVASGLEHQDYPFTRLVEQLRLPNDPTRPPVFQTVFNLLKAQRAGEIAKLYGSGGGLIKFGDLLLEDYPIPQEEGQMDINLEVVETDELDCMLKFNKDLFSRDTVQRMAGHFRTLLDAFMAKPDARVGDVPLLSEAERQQILVDWNNTTIDFPADAFVHHSIEEQAARNPDAVALLFENESMTYGEFNRRANRLAHHLRKIGVRKDVMVGVYTERNLDMLVGLLAILKAGGAYVPMDPFFPQDRLGFMVEDTQMPVMLAQRALLERMPANNAQIVLLDEMPQDTPDTNPEHVTQADDLAYVIFTSGSTGRPKGVLVPHRGLTNLMQASQKMFGVTSADTLMCMSTISFDAATFEIWMALVVGGRLALIPREVVMDGARLAEAIDFHEVTWAGTSLTAFRLMLESGWKGRPGLKMFQGGEALLPDMVERLLDVSSELWNLYGPTEASVMATGVRLERGVKRITIGGPIPNFEIYILDAALNPVPAGVAGTLYIGGVGLARGYLNRPDLTAEKFIPHPFKAGERVYNSGDMARWTADGDIEYLGRADNQVKIRGFRIELGEIEAALNQLPSVRQAVVIAREDTPGNKRLVAYLVSKTGAVDSTALRAALKEVLPMYMIPAVFVGLDALPLMPNGKIDRRALPAPEKTRQTDAAATDFTDMKPMEALIARVWQDVLEVDTITVYDNFFDLGGHSLQVLPMLTKLANETGHKLDPAYIRFQTLGQLAATYEGVIADPGSLQLQADTRLQAEPEALSRKLIRAFKRAVRG